MGYIWIKGHITETPQRIQSNNRGRGLRVLTADKSLRYATVGWTRSYLFLKSVSLFESPIKKLSGEVFRVFRASGRTYCMKEVRNRLRDVTTIARRSDVSRLSEVCCVPYVGENGTVWFRLGNAFSL